MATERWPGHKWKARHQRSLNSDRNHYAVCSYVSSLKAVDYSSCYSMKMLVGLASLLIPRTVPWKKIFCVQCAGTGAIGVEQGESVDLFEAGRVGCGAPGKCRAQSERVRGLPGGH